MTKSFSFATPATSFSTIDLAINPTQDDENLPGLSSSHQSSFHFSSSTTPKRSRDGSILLQTITRDNRTIQSNDDQRTDEDDQLLTSYYDSNRLKQEKLLLIINMFRLLVIFILAPIIYFLV